MTCYVDFEHSTKWHSTKWHSTKWHPTKRNLGTMLYVFFCHSTKCTLQNALYKMHSTKCNLRQQKGYLRNTFYEIHSTKWTLQNALYKIHSTLKKKVIYEIHSTKCDSTKCTLQNTIYKTFSTKCTLRQKNVVYEMHSTKCDSTLIFSSLRNEFILRNKINTICSMKYIST